MNSSILNALYEKKLINSLEYKKIEESTNHDVYEIEDVILKIDNNKERLYKEYVILQKVSTTVACPKPLFFEYIQGDSMSNFVLGIQRINGKPLDHFWLNLSDNLKNNIVESVIEQVKKIHAYNADQIYEEGLDEKIFYNNFIANKFAYIDKAKLNPYVDAVEIQALSDTFLKLYNIEVKNNQGNVLIHNDVRYKNLLMSENGSFMGIIDFEEGLLGPKCIEYFRICDHLFFAQNYIEDGGEDYTEIEFLEMLIKVFEKDYPEAVIGLNSNERVLYSLATYVRLLANFDETWYNHEESIRFRQKYLNMLDK